MSFFKAVFQLQFRVASVPFHCINTERYDPLEIPDLPPLYLASFSLYQQYTAARANDHPIGKDLRAPLTRYHLRMATRATPFGFFAGCGITEWNEQIQINTQQAKFHTRLDHLVLHQLAHQLLSLPAIQTRLRYVPNGSRYPLHDELRYVEYTLTNHKRDYKLSAVAAADPLNTVLDYSRSGAHVADLVAHVARTYAVDPAEAEAYGQELIASQLLVSELEPAITGEEYLPRLIRWMAALEQTEGDHEGVAEVLALLRDVDQRLARIKEGITTVIEQGPRIVEQLRPWLPELTEDKLFQVDTIFPPLAPATPPESSENTEAEQLAEAIDVLNRLTPPAPHPSLTRFAERFAVRYEDREVPLAEVLDAETGVDYLHEAPTTLSPLVEEIILPEADEEQTFTWNKREQWRWNLLQDALYHRQSTVELTDELLKDFTATEDDLPPSLSVMFRRVEGDHRGADHRGADHRNADQLYLDSVGGVSATNLINRFAHADPNIHRLVQDLCDQEQQHNPEVILAEIVHLPESRVGNIMFHPTSRAYEIPYLATPTVDEAHQLPLSDLRVSVRGGRVILRSARLDKEIIPRLSTAHNHSLSELAVYRFLCDLQGQGLRSYLSFGWGPLAARYKFLPRVVYKNVILHPATWQLTAADLAPLKVAKEADFFRAFQDFCTTWKLPRRWVLADGDNELFVDSEQPLTVEAWWDLAKRREELVIKEFFAPAEGAVVNERGEAHAHQLVASWIKQTATYQSTNTVAGGTTPEIARSFTPGSEWLYYKVYGGVSGADRILEEVVAPLVQQLQVEREINQWFFIRYADPNPHLRLRFHLSDVAHLGAVMQRVRDALLPLETAGVLSKLQLDTYHRELERYGGSRRGYGAITEAETLFYHDSEATLAFLSLTEGDAREDLRWLWGLRSIDALLNDFDLDSSEKLTLLQSMKESFAQEFTMDKSLKLQLDKKYRTHRAAITEMRALDDTTDERYSLAEILQQRSARHAPAVAALRRADEQGTLPLALSDLLRSYIHMLVNRLLPSQARLHELVLYDFLYREYRSEMARGKAI